MISCSPQTPFHQDLLLPRLQRQHSDLETCTTQPDSEEYGLPAGQDLRHTIRKFPLLDVRGGQDLRLASSRGDAVQTNTRLEGSREDDRISNPTSTSEPRRGLTNSYGCSSHQ